MGLVKGGGREGGLIISSFRIFLFSLQIIEWLKVKKNEMERRDVFNYALFKE